MGLTRSQHAIVIVGAGPAGSAAALRIASCRPDLATRTLVLDRHEFPRDKRCAGGISPLAEAQLARVHAAPDGIAAADAVVAAIDRRDFDLTRHHERLRRSSIGQVMERRRLRGHAVYRRDPVDRYFHAVRLFGRSKSA